MCTQKKSSSVKITLLLKVDLEGFEQHGPAVGRVKQSAQCNGDDRSQWLKQGGAVGAAF